MKNWNLIKLLRIYVIYVLQILVKILLLNYYLGNNKDIIAKLLKETSEAVLLITKKHSPEFLAFDDLSYIFKILDANGVLTSGALLEIAKILKMSLFLSNYYNTDNDDSSLNYPILDEYFSALYTNPSVLEAIEKSILDEFTISDSA